MLRHNACSCDGLSFLAGRCLLGQFFSSVTDLPKDFQVCHISFTLWKLFRVTSLHVCGKPHWYQGLDWAAIQQFHNYQVWHYFFAYSVFSDI